MTKEDFAENFVKLILQYGAENHATVQNVNVSLADPEKTPAGQLRYHFNVETIPNPQPDMEPLEKMAIGQMLNALVFQGTGTISNN